MLKPLLLAITILSIGVIGDHSADNIRRLQGWEETTESPTKKPIQMWVAPEPTYKPTAKPTPSPTWKPTPSPTWKPTPSPTWKPTPSPTWKPTPSPTWKPTPSPTWKPTPSPTWKPTPSPTWKPTPSPTWKPTPSPTWKPTPSPTWKPTPSPTWKPTKNPTWSPTKKPTWSPTKNPTWSPTKKPTWSPTKNPTWSPTKKPTWSPTKNPTWSPTKKPTWSPTKNPTWSPTKKPTWSPTKSPTKNPTKSPTNSPTPHTPCPTVSKKTYTAYCGGEIDDGRSTCFLNYDMIENWGYTCGALNSQDMIETPLISETGSSMNTCDLYDKVEVGSCKIIKDECNIEVEIETFDMNYCVLKEVSIWHGSTELPKDTTGNYVEPDDTHYQFDEKLPELDIFGCELDNAEKSKYVVVKAEVECQASHYGEEPEKPATTWSGPETTKKETYTTKYPETTEEMMYTEKPETTEKMVYTTKKPETTEPEVTIPSVLWSPGTGGVKPGVGMRR